MFQKLLDWSQENGVIIYGELELIGQDNRSIITKKDIPKDEIIIKFPKKLTIGSIISLLNEILKGDQSKFNIYLSMLPKKLNLPINKISYLKVDHPEISKTFKNYNDGIEELYSQIVSLDIPEKYKSREYITYLYNLYNTRCWRHYGFVPLVDLFQHSNQPNIFIDTKSDDKYFIVITLKDIVTGEELMHRYNDFDPFKLYLFYGIDN
jgi:hypothetical protein